MTKPTRYCFRKPAFPAKAWGIALFAERNGELTDIHVMSPVFCELTEIPVFVANLLKSLAKEPTTKEMTMIEECLLIPLTLATTLPLKREYWDNPAFDFGVVERYRAFLAFLKAPLAFHLLTVPRIDDKKCWHFDLAAPFRRGDDAAIETFMKTSNYPVNQEASEAALYDAANFKTFNWRTLAVREVEPMQWPETVTSQ